MKACSFRGEEGQLFEAVFPPLPYDPSPPFHVAKGDTPLETPAGVSGYCPKISKVLKTTQKSNIICNDDISKNC